MKRMRFDDQMRDIKNTKFTYKLETDEEDRMGWDDQMRDLTPIDQDHVPTG